MNRAVSGRVAAVGVVLLTLGLTSCATAEDEATDGAQRVGVAMPTTTQVRWIDDGENVRAQLEDLGHEVDLQFAEDDAATQVGQIQQMIDDGADALVIGAVDGTTLRDVLAEAGAAGIPVISYDRLIRDSTDIDYYATFDNLKVGVQQATVLLEGLGVLDEKGAPTGATGPYAVEIFAGSPDDNNATVFYEGAMSVLEPYLTSGVLVIPSGQRDFSTVATPAWDGETAAARMRTLTGAYDGTGLRLDGLLAPNDGVARALIGVVAGLGYGSADTPWPIVTGQDAEVDSIKSIIAGEQGSTIYKDTRQLAEVAVSMVDALLNGEEPETNDVSSYDNGVMTVPSYLLASQVVTLENYESVLVESGYYTPEDLR